MINMIGLFPRRIKTGKVKYEKFKPNFLIFNGGFFVKCIRAETLSFGH
jgi:hypothetical protein